MKDRAAEFLGLFAYVLAGISGGLGGCGAASAQFLRANGQARLRLAYLLAYCVIGIIGGVLFAAYALQFDAAAHTLADVVPGSILAGMMLSAILAGTNITARWVLRRLGIEVEVTVRRHDEERRL